MRAKKGGKFQLKQGGLACKQNPNRRKNKERTPQTKSVFGAYEGCGWATFLFGCECDNTGGPLFGVSRTLIGQETILCRGVSDALTFWMESGIER